MHLDFDGAWDVLEGILLVDSIVEEDSVEMVNLVLEDDGVIASGGDLHIGADFGVIGLDDDLEVAVDAAGVLGIDAKAAFSCGEVGLADGVDDDLRVDELILDERISLISSRVGDDEHPLVNADLRSGESDAFAAARMLLAVFFVLGQFEIFKHLIEGLLIFCRKRHLNLFRFCA